jgi:hypothetical protein
VNLLGSASEGVKWAAAAALKLLAVDADTKEAIDAAKVSGYLMPEGHIAW